MLPTPRWPARDLTAGTVLAGPAVVQADTTTVVVNPGDELRVLPDGGYELSIAVEAA